MTANDAQDATKSARIMPEDLPTPGGGLWARLQHWLLRRLWYVHSGITLHLNMPRGTVLTVLETAAKPSVQRLHLRNVFANGRRYFFGVRRDGGFRLTSTNKVFWHHKRRTSPTAVINADLEALNDSLTRLDLHGRIRVGYLLDIFWLPLFMVSLIVFMPWPIPVIIGLSALLFGCSWFGHRYHAALEVQEMLFFVEKALEDYIAKSAPVLTAESGGDVVYHQRDFNQAWEQFYQEHTQ